jgi:hypothetical protein
MKNNHIANDECIQWLKEEKKLGRYFLSVFFSIRARSTGKMY